MSGRLVVRRPASFGGSIRVPADKSLTHRAYMFGAIASGESIVRRPLRGDDCEATLRCLAQMGLSYEWRFDTEIVLKPAKNWHSPHATLDCGNSGTTIRLVSGLIASRAIEATMVGDPSLSKRPMRRIAEPLRQMGAVVEGETPPLFIKGSDSLNALDFHSPVASAQVKSCVLLAGLRANGTTTVSEPAKSRDHTERMLRACGIDVVTNDLSVSVVGGQDFDGFEFEVPGDISSAAFFMAAGAMIPEAQIELLGVGVNPTRTGIFDVFERAGLSVLFDNERQSLGEPVADVFVRHAGIGMPFEIGGDLVPRLLDEIPILAVLATQLDGVSKIRDTEELRVKESDRIEAVAKGLKAMGAEVETYSDGLDVSGPVRLRGTTIDAANDHRIAMAFAIAGLVSDGETVIEGAESIATSYPDFERDLWGSCVF